LKELNAFFDTFELRPSICSNLVFGSDTRSCGYCGMRDVIDQNQRRSCGAACVHPLYAWLMTELGENAHCVMPPLGVKSINEPHERVVVRESELSKA
jgi:hypothetical protein